MSKKIHLFISFLMILSCLCSIVYCINYRREQYEIKSNTEVVSKNIQEDKYIENTEVYDEFLKNFNCQGDKYYYAFIELEGFDYPILLLSNEVYKFKQESEVAMGTDVYYPVHNEIINFGNIGSSGTAYPISVNTTGIFTAGGHQVTKYSLDIKNQKMKLITKYMMFFHKEGQKVNTITIGVIGDDIKIVSEEDFTKAMNEYGKKIVYFKRLC